MSDLVTLAEAKTHLRVVGTASDAEIQTLADIAEAIVFEHLMDGDYDDFLERVGSRNTAPVEAAVKLVLTNLYDKRDENPLSEAAQNLLRPWREPIVE